MARDIGDVAEDARNWERVALRAGTRSEVGYFAANQLRAETRWVDALVALLTWAPPVEVRPKLHGPSPEALARGLVVGAVVRDASPVDEAAGEWRSVVVGHDADGDPIVCDDAPYDDPVRQHAWRALGLTVVLPPPALDSWLLDAHAIESYVHHAAVPRFIAEARRLVELVRGGAR